MQLQPLKISHACIRVAPIRLPATTMKALAAMTALAHTVDVPSRMLAIMTLMLVATTDHACSLVVLM
jgi:hypothetical protein